MRIMKKGGWNPTYAFMSVLGDSDPTIYAEWATEQEARAYAAEFGKLIEVDVWFDDDLGWNTLAILKRK